MAIYTGEVIDSTIPDFPFISVITDESGKVVGEFPVRTKADGEAKIMETLRGLEDQANKVKTDENSA